MYKVLFIFLVFASATVAQKPNVLFIAVDDLNCDINAYGNAVVSSPNLDALADDGSIFMNNHCQQAVCGASRASLLTGWMPQKSGVTSFYTYFRDLYPNMVTIPQFFKNKDYQVEGVGKIHDPRNVSEFNDDTYDKVSWDHWHTISNSGRYINANGKPSTEMVDAADSEYNDGKHTQVAVDRITALAKSDQPFFFAVGFQKPHLPFVAPKKYWDLYDRATIPLRTFKDNASNDFDDFYNRGGELRGYDDIPEEGTIAEAKERELLHGYYACVSFIDAQVGRVINALKESGEYDNTVIVFWGDHGWHLGDHNMWTKHTNFEQATRSPLLIKGIGTKKNNVLTAPTGHIDIFPTLVDLAGYDIPSDKDGQSLVPLLHSSEASVNDFTVSRFTRGGYDGNALRNERYRYVEWNKNGDMKYQLFDYQEDSLETENLAYEPEYNDLIANLSTQLNAYLERFTGGGYNFDFEMVSNGIPQMWSMLTQQNGSGEILASSDAHSGFYALKIVNNTDARIQDLMARCDKSYSTKEAVKISFYAKGSQGTKLRINTQYIYDNNDKKYTSSPEFELTDQYEKYEYVVEPKLNDNNDEQSGFFLRFQCGSVAGDYIIDDVLISKYNPSVIVEKKSTDLRIFPNPGNGIISLNKSVSAVEIYSMSGYLLYQSSFMSPTNDIDVAFLGSGVFMCRFQLFSGENLCDRLIIH